MRHIRDPIHQFIAVNELEARLIDSRPVQRLRHIHQLSTTSLVYPGATHTRFEHALGTMHLASRAFDAAIAHAPDRSLVRLYGLDESGRRQRARQMVRLAGLLHDVGHAPFSHGPEELFPRDGRGGAILHEHMTIKAIRETGVADILRSDPLNPFDPELIAAIAVGPEYAPIDDPQILLLSSLVTGNIGVDRMDYLLRDSHATGVGYGYFDLDRIISSMLLVAGPEGPVWGIDASGVHAAEQLMLARRSMFLQVYYHKTRRILDRHLIDFLREVTLTDYGGTFPVDDLDAYLSLADDDVLTQARRLAQQSAATAGRAGELARRILARGHLRLCREFEARDFESPDGFQELGTALVERFESVADAFTIRVAKSGDPEIYISDGSRGEIGTLVERSEALRGIAPEWKGRIYVDAEHREGAMTVLDGLAGKEPDHDE